MTHKVQFDRNNNNSKSRICVWCIIKIWATFKAIINFSWNITSSRFLFNPFWVDWQSYFRKRKWWIDRQQSLPFFRIPWLLCIIQFIVLSIGQNVQRWQNVRIFFVKVLTDTDNWFNISWLTEYIFVFMFSNTKISW